MAVAAPLTKIEKQKIHRSVFRRIFSIFLDNYVFMQFVQEKKFESKIRKDPPKNMPKSWKKRRKFFYFRWNLSTFSEKLRFGAVWREKNSLRKSDKKWRKLEKKSKRHTKKAEFREKKDTIGKQSLQDFRICKEFGFQSYIRRNAPIWLNIAKLKIIIIK